MSDFTKNKNILIVDDTLANLKLLADVLSRCGYEVRPVNDGQLAISGAKALPPDLILLDINMPEMSGYEVCEQLMRDEKTNNIPIIFISALDDITDKVRAFELGGVDYITKPFQEKEVLARVKTHLELRDMQKRLEEQHQQFKQAQSQLIQSEKMAGLGVLVAGVAHEINNPTNFVQSGAVNLNSRIKQLEDFIYKLAGDNVTLAIKEALEEKFQPIFENLEAICEGTSRIQDIVQDLKVFSRLEDSERKNVSITEGLNTSLALVRANYKNEIEFLCDFQADPSIECWPAELNQVFVNLMVNACQAIEEKRKQTGNSNPGQLKVSTCLDENRLKICFQDNGIGMSHDIQSRVFEPFFTTKSVGEGTGLGLSISFGIIEKHNGRIEVESTPGEGTIFNLYLPIEQ